MGGDDDINYEVRDALKDEITCSVDTELISANNKRLDLAPKRKPRKVPTNCIAKRQQALADNTALDIGVTTAEPIAGEAGEAPWHLEESSSSSDEGGDEGGLSLGAFTAVLIVMI